MLKKDRREYYRALVLGAVIAGAFFIRTQGALLLASYGVLELFHLWTNRKDPEMVKKIIWGLVFVCASFGLLWLVYALIFPGGGESYFNQYKDFQMSRALGFVGAYFHVFGDFFGTSNVWKVIYYLSFLFFLIGLWVRRWEETIFIVFFLVWMLLLLTWPAWQGPRFIFPLFPIFLYFVFQGVRFIIEKTPQQNQIWIQRICISFWVIIIGVFLFRSGSEAYENLKANRAPSSAYDHFSMDMYEFIRENTAPDSIIVFFKPRAMRLFTDRDSYMARTCSELTRGDYVVINKLAENSQVPEDKVDECGLPLQSVFESKRFIVFKIMK
jgi:hypothetical protein